jgi:hypothetical protein
MIDETAVVAESATSDILAEFSTFSTVSASAASGYCYEVDCAVMPVSAMAFKPCSLTRSSLCKTRIYSRVVKFDDARVFT